MRDRSLLILPILGAMVFASGLELAMWRLPEWRTRDLPDRSTLERRMDQVLAKAGLRRTGEIGDVDVASRTMVTDEGHPVADAAYQSLGPAAADWLFREGRGFFVRVVAPAAWSDGAGAGIADATFSTRAQPVSLMWITSKWSGFVSSGPRAEVAERDVAFATAMLAPGERLGQREMSRVGGQEMRLLQIESPSPVRETADVTETGGLVEGERLIGTVASIKNGLAQEFSLGRIVSRFTIGAGKSLLAIGIVVLFIALLVQRRIAFGNAAVMAALVCACSISSVIRFLGLGWYGWIQLGTVVGSVLWTLVVWSSVESWLRSHEASSVTPFDGLCRARIGPRSGGSLVVGWAVGAAAAGIWLASVTLATTVAATRQTKPTVDLPVFASSSPVLLGIFIAGAIVLAHLVSTFVKGKRWAVPIAVGVGAFFMAPRIGVAPYPLQFVVGLAIAALLLTALERSGLAGLFTASLAMVALPAFVFCAIHASWMKGAFAGSALFAIGPLFVGAIGVARPPEAESTRLAAPGFVRRLEQERRIRYEMDLLSTMQLRLLPQAPPMIDGWDIAARSILATEAGGDLYDFLEDDDGMLWIAVGDVSGHGYSCAIAQAMTKAGLTSIVRAGESPASVLHQLDRVLRRSGSPRTFTSLVLVRLDPKTGEAVWSNAGNPYPVLVSTRGVAEEVVSSSLPLGVGPPRRYEDRSLAIPPGGALVFFSDGLYEARNEREEAMGFETPISIVERTWRRPASAILDALVVAWRDHIGLAEMDDDTTVVVVRRNM